MLGLRISEACATDITDIRYEAGYELLHVLGKGAKPPTSRCHLVLGAGGKPSTGARPVRSGGPAPGGGWTARVSAGHLTRVARAAGIGNPISPHGTGHAACLAGMSTG